MRLELEWRERQVRDRSRRYLEFIVDGEPLSGERYRAWDISVLGWGRPEEEERAARRLLLEEPPDMDGRVCLYVAACCGKECGATTVFVEQHGAEIVWRDAAFNCGYDQYHDRDAYRQWPDEPRFDAAEYRRVIEGRPRTAPHD